MAAQENVEAQVQQAVDAVLETGDHTEGGASVDEAVAAKAQELAASDAPLDKIEAAAPADVEPSEPVTEPDSATEPVPAEAEVPVEANEAPPAPPVPEADPSVPAAETAADLAAEPTPVAEEAKEDDLATETPAQAPVPAAEPESQAAEPEPLAAEPEPQAAGTKRPAEDAAPAEEDAPPAKAAKFEIDPEDPNAEYFTQILQIPAGQTRTFSDIAVGAGAKPSAARSIGRTVAKISVDELGLPWWRVVSSIGALQSNPVRQEVQLARLRAEGARPEEGEGIIEWAARVGTKFVGTYTLGSLRMVYAEHDNDDVTTFNPHTVEPFASREQAAERGFSKMV